MSTYLLETEKKQLEKLSNNLDKTLYQTTPIIKNELINIIKNNKDSSINDILTNLLNNLSNEMIPLLDKHLTLGLQFEIKNNYFTLKSYGGQKQTSPIEENTFFSFDSISKIITSIITMYQVRNNKLTLNTKVNEFNPSYQLDDTIESILKFTSYIQTNKRIDNLPKEETIKLLKECKDSLKNKELYKNYYQYNDIGYMILRQIIPNFLIELDNLLNIIDKENLTYKINSNITGGKKNEENKTPDTKGRDIPFPGHTGLYGNVDGLITIFDKLINTETILTTKEKEILYKQPYQDPIIYTKDNNPLLNSNNMPKYTNKIAGIYKIPNGITTKYDKLSSFDIPNYTTINALASSGTCGSWVITDKTIYGTYTAGLLTNPYSFIENTKYPNEKNIIPNTPLEVNQNGKIINYSKHLNPYKNILTIYSNILELLTEYIKISNNNIIPNKLTKKKSL